MGINKIPTAEEFFKENKYPSFNNNGGVGMYYVKEAMIEFAKLHVEQALREAEIIAQKTWGNSKIMKESVLNAYPLENIK